MFFSENRMHVMLHLLKWALNVSCAGASEWTASIKRMRNCSEHVLRVECSTKTLVCQRSSHFGLTLVRCAVGEFFYLFTTVCCSAGLFFDNFTSETAAGMARGIMVSLWPPSQVMTMMIKRMWQRRWRALWREWRRITTLGLPRMRTPTAENPSTPHLSTTTLHTRYNVLNVFVLPWLP